MSDLTKLRILAGIPVTAKKTTIVEKCKKTSTEQEEVLDNDEKDDVKDDDNTSKTEISKEIGETDDKEKETKEEVKEDSGQWYDIKAIVDGKETGITISAISSPEARKLAKDRFGDDVVIKSVTKNEVRDTDDKSDKSDKSENEEDSDKDSEDLKEGWYAVTVPNHGFSIWADTLSAAVIEAKKRSREVLSVEADKYMNGVTQNIRSAMKEMVAKSRVTQNLESLRKSYLRKIESAKGDELFNLYKKVKKDLTPLSTEEVEQILDDYEKRKKTDIKEYVMYYDVNEPASGNMKVNDESPNQLDNIGSPSNTDSEQKVKVPPHIKQLLRSEIEQVRKESEKLGVTQTEARQFYKELAKALEELHEFLERGTVSDIKKAQVFWSSLMGPILHKVPSEVSDFIVNGGQRRPLSSYFTQIKNS